MKNLMVHIFIYSPLKFIFCIVIQLITFKSVVPKLNVRNAFDEGELDLEEF